MPVQDAFIFKGFTTWDSTSGVDNLPPAAGSPAFGTLSIAENCRFTQKGGVFVRGGTKIVADLGTGAKVDSIRGVENDAWQVMFAKSGTKIFQSKDGETWYTTGVTRTASEIDFLFPKRKNVFAINQTDNFLYFHVTTVVSVDTGAQTLTVRTGDGTDLPTSGTFYVRGIAVTYSGVSTDTLTGCTGLTAAMAAGDILTVSVTDSNLPKGTCMGELDGSGLLGGVSADPTTFYFSSASTPANPELFYDYPTNYRKSLPRDITAIVSGSSVTLICMKKGMQYSAGFNTEVGAPSTTPLNGTHSFHSAFAVTQADEDFIGVTGEGRILEIGQTDSGFQVRENPKNPKQDTDYPVQGFLQSSIDRDNPESNFTHYDPSTRTVSSTILLNTGITTELVYQRDIGAWSRDTGKNFSCKTVFKGRTYCGSDFDDSIYLEDEGMTDAGIPIAFRINTGALSIDDQRTTFDVLKLTLGGLLSATGSFTVRVITDGELAYTEDVTAEDLINRRLMSLTSGRPIGQGQISAELIGSGGPAVTGYRFTCPIELLLECETVLIEIESFDEATALELRTLRIDFETEGEQSFDTL